MRKKTLTASVMGCSRGLSTGRTALAYYSPEPEHHHRTIEEADLNLRKKRLVRCSAAEVIKTEAVNFL